MDRILLGLGGTSAFLSVALGAFGSHGLKALLSADLLAAFEVGVRYQMYHALAMIAVGLLLPMRPARALRASGWLFAIGTVLFSGSLYALALSGIRSLGMITPIGGVAFLAGWLCFAWGAWRA